MQGTQEPELTLSSGSRCQALGKLWLQKTSGSHRPWAERGTHLEGSEAQRHITRGLEADLPQARPLSGWSMVDLWNSLASASAEVMGQDGDPPQDSRMGT